jgi:DNA-binding transcriptional LysR family regulator
MLDPRLFKAFIAAAKSENFTLAATAANMTQSGVSQHVGKLEDQLAVPLFKRMGKKVLLTEHGRRLIQHVEAYGLAVERLMESVSGEQVALAGPVSYGMPPSCLLSPHFSMLLERRRAHPGIELTVRLAPSPQVMQMVLDGDIDFGFVTQKTRHPMLAVRPFCQEEFVLVGADGKDLAGIKASTVLQKKFIHFPGSDAYYNLWLRHHLGAGSGLDALSLPRAGWIDDIDGAVKMVEGRLGIGVFPRHCVAGRLQEGRLFEFASRRPPLLNDISIITIAKYKHPRRVIQVMDWFLEMHKDG